MKMERELFEDWCHINDEFCTHRYTDNCQEYSDDCTQSAWFAWQEQQKKIDELQARIDEALRHVVDHGGYDDLTHVINILKAVEK